jgi:Zn-dependent membrane protease YugP
MFFFDWTIILIIPAVILSIYAQWKVKSTVDKYHGVPTRKGLTGAKVAEALLRENGIDAVTIEEGEGLLSDHYNPQTKKIRLSPEIFNGRSISALGVAAHEVGHAIQHHTGYYPLQLRHSIVPVTNIGSWLAFPLIFAGFLFSATSLIDIGIIFFSVVVLFQVVTLPVEFNASRRALAFLGDSNYLNPEEVGMAKQVLKAAALTYVAAATVAILELVRFLILRQSSDE